MATLEFGRKVTKVNFVVNRKGDLIFGFHLQDPQLGSTVPFPPGTRGRLEIGDFDAFEEYWVDPTPDGALRWKLESEETDNFATGQPGRIYVVYGSTTPVTDLFVFGGPVKRSDQ